MSLGLRGQIVPLRPLAIPPVLTTHFLLHAGDPEATTAKQHVIEEGEQSECSLYGGQRMVKGPGAREEGAPDE